MTAASTGQPRSPRVLFIAADLSTGGGVNKMIRDLAVLFRRRFSIAVTVFNARSDEPSAYAFPDDIKVEWGRRQSLGTYFADLWRLRPRKPAVVISSWTQDNIMATLAFLGSGTRVILVEHGSWHHQPRTIRWLRRLVYPLASAVVVLNPSDLAHYQAWLDNVRLIPNPVVAPSLPDVSRGKLIVAIGHLEPLKQFDHALMAMAQSGLEGRGWSLLIVGAGSEQAHLEQLIGSLGLERTQIAPPGELTEYYAQATMLLVTSRTESFSLVTAEAMLAGVIPIAYASDGPRFLLQDFPAQLVPIDDIDSLAIRMTEVADAADLDRLRQRLRANVEARFSLDLIADQWAELL